MADPNLIRRWIGRLTFTFLAIAFLFGWQAYKRYAASGDLLGDWRTLGDWFAAAIFVALAMVGVRDRHHRP